MSLMTYIWGLKYSDFSHICPYFWLSVLNLIIILPVAFVKIILGKGLLGGIALFFKKLYDYSVRARERKIKRKIRIAKDPKRRPELFNMCYKNFFALMRDIKYIDFALYIELVDKRNAILQAQLDDEERRKKAQIEAAIKRKAFINRVLWWTKPIMIGLVWLFVALGVSTIGYMAFKLIMFFVHLKYPPVDWKLLSGIVEILALAVLVIWLIVRFFIWLSNNVTCKVAPPWASAVGRGIMWVLTGIGTIISMAVAMAQNNCPGIDWEE